MVKTLWVFLLGACLISCKPEPVGWQRISPNVKPPPVTNGAAAYNTASATAVLFSGVTDKYTEETWIWHNENWTLLTPQDHPVGRQNSAMTYDESRDRVVLFGGLAFDTVFDDTWEWYGENWYLMEPVHKPPPRCCHSLAYDHSLQQVVLYGGWDSRSNTFLADTWLWDGTDWTDVTCCDMPTMSGHNMIWVPVLDEIIALQTGEFGTWAWNDKIWRDLDLEDPPDRSEVRLAFDSQHNWLILFGGYKDGQPLSDTWVFDGQEWLEANLSNHPPARYGHVMFYDTERERVILFGGYDAEIEGSSNETWVLNLPDDLSSLSAMPATQTPSD